MTVMRRDMAWLFLLPLDQIANVSKVYNLDPKLVASIVMVESSGEPCATRYEPHFKYLLTPKLFSTQLRITEETEIQQQKMSFGLMQVMGSVARELGHEGHLVELCEPTVGLNYGCKQLKRLFDRYGKLGDVVSAYNQGSPRKTLSGEYRNQSYVDKVLDKYTALYD